MFTKISASAVASALVLSLVSGVASAGDILSRFDKETCAAPDYSSAWRDEEPQGDVKVKLLVSPDGTVTDAKLVESSGYATLDKASLRASVKCKFKPVAKDSDIAQGWVNVRYTWVLN
ncbi:energy transducer TonB [Duganella vulcania]|uniref:TonB family protein n=1 Tax=Duganella vulcania TaxID=2692166 RepID=A0A845GWB9_9BURK|nr:energy transducer TonB [Duganella vulcania]MYM98584.1 TonB family protein [Duganella vulcania]